MSTVADRILRPEIVRYLGGLPPDPGATARRIEGEAERDGVPILTREQGLFLEVLARISGARSVLEVGTGFGYGTLFLARGMGPDGRIVSIDIDAARQRRARAFLEEEGVEPQIELVAGRALEILPDKCRKSDTWDFVLLDAVKEEYRSYVEVSLPALRAGGLIVVDNLLWMGMAAGMPLLEERHRAANEAIQAFNPWFLSHPSFSASVLLPVGDGLGLGVKS